MKATNNTITTYVLKAEDIIFIDRYNNETDQYDIQSIKLKAGHLTSPRYQDPIYDNLILNKTTVKTNDSVYQFAQYYPLYERQIKLNGAGMGIGESQKYKIRKSKGYSLTQNDIEKIVNMKNFLIKEEKAKEEARNEASELANAYYKEQYTKILNEKLKSIQNH